MGRAWGQNLKENSDVTLAAWVDVRPGVAAEASTTLELSPDHTGTDIEEAIAKAKPDFVVDVTPPEIHHDVTLLALKHGLPIIGEKPMAASMAQARAMVAASERAGKLYMVSQSRRYIGRINAYRELIKTYLGDLGILNADFYIGAHFGGFRDEMPSPLVLDMAIHTFDEARYISGADPVSVYAEEFNPRWSWYKGDASANALFEMSNGLRFAYRGSWCAEGCSTSWDGDWRAIGANGTALWVGDQPPTGQVVAKSGGFHSEMKDVSIPVPSISEGIKGSLEEFLSALKTGVTPNGECHDNIKSLAMVFASIESAALGTRVKVEV